MSFIGSEGVDRRATEYSGDGLTIEHGVGPPSEDAKSQASITRLGSLALGGLALIADVLTLGVFAYQFRSGEIEIATSEDRLNLLWAGVFMLTLAVFAVAAYVFGSRGRDTRLLSGMFAFIYCGVAVATLVVGGIAGLWETYVFLGAVAIGAILLATILIQIDGLYGQIYSLTFMAGGLALPVALVNLQLGEIWWDVGAADRSRYYLNLVVSFLSICGAATWFIVLDRVSNRRGFFR